MARRKATREQEELFLLITDTINTALRLGSKAKYGEIEKGNREPPSVIEFNYRRVEGALTFQVKLSVGKEGTFLLTGEVLLLYEELKRIYT